MQIGVPDPTHTSSARARANFRLALAIAAVFTGFIWLIALSDWALDLNSGEFGVRPRNAWGLPGILVAPLLHADFMHLIANTPPLLALGTAMLYLYPAAAPIVLPAIYLGPGIAVWIFGRDSVHLGASGLVYGLAAYIFVAGLLRRDRRAIAASLLVSFVYGALLWGVLPIKSGVSWETHLAAALVGVILALALRGRDIPPRKRYTYEDEPDVDPFDGEWDTRRASVGAPAEGAPQDSAAHERATHDGAPGDGHGESSARRIN
jgi:membrane associated rhomboid family serine protease